MSNSDVSSESPFETVSDVSLSRTDRLKAFLQEWVITPFRILMEDKRTVLGFAIVAGYVLMGTLGVLLVEAPKSNEGPRLVPPFQSLQFPFGTDAMGQGLFAMIVHATPAMLKMLVSGAIFATFMATAIGTFAGYKGGAIDSVLTTIMDITLTIPGLPLIIVIAATFQPKDPFVIGILLTINVWAGLARSIRSEVLTLRQESYVEAARTMGVPTHRIITHNILPNLMPYILINFMNAGRTVIFNSVGLYFLGLLPFTALNWGVMLNMAVSSGALGTWKTLHWVFFPTATIILLSYGMIMLSQGMDKIFNPRVRARNQGAHHEK